MYNRYAESARVNWTRNFAAADPAHAKQWMELITPKSIGLILRSITTDYKFVSNFAFLCLWNPGVVQDGIEYPVRRIHAERGRVSE
jgi:hypothetical protein